MKERPILFSGPLVLALLAGTKTQTRRLVSPQPNAAHGLQPMWGRSPAPDPVDFGTKWLWREVGPDYPDGPEDDRRSPYGVPGDRLWVRETWHDDIDREPGDPIETAQDGRVAGIEYRASHDCTNFEAGCPCNPDGDGKRSEWRPSIYMPRWASRITLEITDVRVEQLQQISEADARAEGLQRQPGKGMRLYPSARAARTDSTCRDEFRELWDKINGKRATWQSNPWVWVLGFRRVEQAVAA